MALLSEEKRKEYFKELGLGEYNKTNILKMQKKYMYRKTDWDGVYGTDCDNLLRHLKAVKDNCKDFAPEEFHCGCNGKYCCGYPTWMKPVELKNIQSIRTHFGKPMVVTCGLRCTHYNQEVGGIARSEHLFGLATDYYIQGVTDTLANRKQSIKWISKLPNHSYTYGNGIYVSTSDGSTKTGYVSARGMGNAMHTDSKEGVTPKPTPPGKIAVDGIGGPATVKAMQKFFGTTQDGVISGQNLALQKYYPSLTAVKGGSGGSPCIKNLQRWVGVTMDGVIGPATVKALQKKLGISNQDGIWGTTTMKTWQVYLNNNDKPVYPPSPIPTKSTKVIDVSEFQSTIDWNKAKADGVQGVIVRCGLRGAGSAKLIEDSMFLKHIKGAFAVGLPVGIYMFTEAINAKEGREEADYAINLWQKAGLPISYPIGVDTENVFYKEDGVKKPGRANSTELSKAKRTEAIKAFCEQIKAKGYTPMIYASLLWFRDQLDMSKLPYDVWVAQYNNTCDYKGKYVMWQYTSSGRISGISSNVDLNHCYIEPKAVNPPKQSDPKPYSGSYPTNAEIKSASNTGTGRRIVAWCKQICESGEYKYKVFTDDPKTQQCPICHNLTGKYKGFNCIGFSWAAWRHGGGIPSKCNCEVINDNKGNQLIRASSDAEATKMVQKCAGITDLKVIRNKSGIPESDLNLGDIILYYDGTEYEHSLVYVGDGKVADSGRGHTPQVMFGGTYKKNKCKVAIQYTGGNSYLQRLDKGKGVRKIKDFLEWYDTKTKLADDDSFGNGTRNAVIAFQEKEMGKAQADGFVGPKTIEAMKAVRK